MPGLSQLKQFNKDMLAIGNETSNRASRGEHPIRVPIPKTITDINDSNDFVLGMPENELVVEETPVDNDLSDIINTNADSAPVSQENAENDGPDLGLSSLLNPMGEMLDGNDADGMPDLSAFMDEPVASEPEPEPEPEPVSIADMGLEALLSGTGFDGSDISEIEDTGYTPNINSDDYYTDEELEEIAPPEKLSKSDKRVGNLNFDEIDDIPGLNKNDIAPETVTEDFSIEDLLPEESIDELSADNPETASETETEFSDDFSMPEIPEVSDFNSNTAEESFEDFNLDDLNLDDLGNMEEPSGGDDIFSNDESFNGNETFADDANFRDEPSFADEEFTDSTEEISSDDNIETENSGSDTDSYASTPFDFGKIDISAFPDSDPTHVSEPLNDFDYPDENAEYEEPVAKASDEVDDILNNIEEMDVPEITPKSEFDDLDLDNVEDLGIDLDSSDNTSSENNSDESPKESFGDLEVYDMGNTDIPMEGSDSVDDILDLDAGLDALEGLEEIPEIGDAGGDLEPLDSLDSMDMSDGLEEIGDLDLDGLEVIGGDDNIEDIAGTEGLDDIGDLSTDSSDLSMDGLEALGDLDLDDGISEMTSPEDLSESAESMNATDDSAENLDFDLDSINLDGIGVLDSPVKESAGVSDTDGDMPFDDGVEGELEGLFPDYEEEIPETSEASESDDLFNVDIDDTGAAEPPDGAEDIFSDFDASELEGLDFSTGDGSDTDTGLEDADSSFELGNSDDFAFEGSDFEIAGYTDVDIAKEEKKAPVLPTPDFSGAMEGSKLPPNTLSDEQYRQFTENLQTYPLNVRLAFEDLIVRDEFTDDAEFEIIEKIINKVPARQLAATLEKMLDVSLPVPRDFEHRTAAEYEAYKKSLQYQLRNKIIPGALIGILCLLVGFGIFQFVRNCIYYPAKASSLYKQGYVLLEADEYPQSEIKFNEAVEYKINKKWFFNYARGYRKHKQYQRAEDMYDNILKRFKHDKSAGLEYANMELQDIGNYPKAEEIVRRQVLDWHINDPDGILTLGDTFLEWATEKDPSKYENARQQYATLINLYGAKPLYLSRMMRYFVRTDNLQQVLQLKSSFDNNKKFKYDSEDITELSGYLLDKLYGTVTPAEEYLKNRIEGVRGLLLTAVKTNPKNPGAWYNLSRYYINTRETASIERALQRTIQEFNEADTLKVRDIYNYIDSYRLLGEYYVGKEDYLKAQEQYTEGLSLYTTERDNAGFAGTEKIGHLYSDLANINYFVSSEYKQALSNYEHAVELKFDNPQIRYRIGYIQYRNRNYAEALSSFMKASEGNIRHKNLMLAMANTLSLRGDDYAASGYYEGLISILDSEINEEGIVFPQANAKHNDLVNNYLYASNNYGVTLHRLAVRTGDSSKNADAIVQFQQSVRAWDALTRNQESMVRLEGSNLALENIRYITHPFSDYEPAIYTDIKKVLTDAEGIK